MKKNPHNQRNFFCFVTGKSGGHIVPSLTYAQQLLAQKPDYKIIFFSTDASLDRHILAGNPLVMRHIPLPLGVLPRSIFGYVGFAIKMVYACFKAFFVFVAQRPARIISTGGYVAIPVCFAGWLLRIPIELQELNATPGKAIKFLAPLATQIKVCFAQAARYFPARKTVLMDYPVRFTDEQKNIPHQDALRSLGLAGHKKTLFVLGGSQGSRYINTLVQAWVASDPLVGEKVQIIHQTGADDKQAVQECYAYHAITAQVFEYADALERYYAAADLIIGRAGAGTLFEIQFFNKPCIIIPLETADNDHQVANAQAFTQQFPMLANVVRQREIELDKAAFFAILSGKLLGN